MAEPITVARPYAQAVFRLAREAGRLEAWQAQLDLLAAVAAHPDMARLIGDPRLTRTQLADLVLEIAGERLDEAGRNFVRLLAENRRLGLLPVIRELFTQLRHAAEGEVDVELVTASEVPESLVGQIADALRRRLNREVSLSTRIDPGLLGGAVIRAGDLVIDGSVRGRLARLAQLLSH